MSTLTEVSDWFVAPDGRSFLFRSHTPLDGEWYYSPGEGEAFYALTGSTSLMSNTGESLRGVYHFAEPRSGLSGLLERKDAVLTYEGVAFLLDVEGWDSPRAEQVLHTVGLPFARKPVFLSQLPDESLLYISKTPYRVAEEGMKLFYGTVGAMREISIDRIEKPRPGGLFYLYTSEGTFYHPKDFSRGGPSNKWLPKDQDGAEWLTLTDVDPSWFMIDETFEGELTLIKVESE